MVRGIAWDSLPNRFQPTDLNSKKKEEAIQEIQPHQIDWSKDIPDIGRRTAFGLLVRYLFTC